MDESEWVVVGEDEDDIEDSNVVVQRPYTAKQMADINSLPECPLKNLWLQYVYQKDIVFTWYLKNTRAKSRERVVGNILSLFLAWCMHTRKPHYRYILE